MSKQLRMWIILLVLTAGAFGCGTKTQVVLLPEADGTVGKVSVAAGGEAVVLDRAYDSAESTDIAKPAKKTGVLAAAEVEKTFAGALSAQPLPPVRYILYFEFGSADLTPESRSEIPDILKSIRDRVMVEISVSGHTDRVGSAEVNKKLAAKRAEQMRQILLDNGVPAEQIVTESHGEGNPLIPTDDEVPEPRNRRAEVVIR